MPFAPTADRVFFGLAVPGAGRATRRLATIPFAGGAPTLVWPAERWQLEGLDLVRSLPAAAAAGPALTLDVLQAQVQIAKNALRDAIATSPLAGVVAKRHVQVGEKVAFDSPLVTVVDLSDLELQAAVPAVDVQELSIGKTVELTIDGFGERRFTGRVERINPSAEPGTRAILVYVGIPNTDRALRGGMFATGRIALAASAPVPTLPTTAIRTEASLSFLGLGIPPPTPSWGNILSEGRQYIKCCPWITTFSGLAIMLAVLAFNLVGDALRDLLDPRLRGE